MRRPAREGLEDATWFWSACPDHIENPTSIYLANRGIRTAPVPLRAGHCIRINLWS